MKPFEVEKYLYDILTAAKEVKLFAKNCTSYSDYVANKLVKRAVERNFIIMGEAMNRVVKLQPDIKIASAKKIIGFRNVVVHAYDNLLDELVWKIIKDHLDVLIEDVENQLKGKI